jgi:ribonuclease BN (tRNA processing enzyme)
MSGRLVVLGSCGAWPEPGRACSGYVVEYGGVRIVLDLGFGTLPRLLSLVDSAAGEGIDAVVISHAHNDHMVDLAGLLRARHFGARGSAPLPLFAPSGVLDRVGGLEEPDDSAAIARTYDWKPMPGGPYRIGPFSVTGFGLPHFITNAGVRLSADGLTVAFTGDTGPSPVLADLGRDADLYIMEATDRNQRPDTPPAPADAKMHLTARAAGSAAAAAGARRLLLTHFWPGNDREASRTAAQEVFAGEVLIASEGLEVPLP